MEKPKIRKEDFAWWIYLGLIVAIAIYGFWQSEAAEALLRGIKEVFSLLLLE